MEHAFFAMQNFSRWTSSFGKRRFFGYFLVCVCLRSTWRHLKNQILRMMMILSDHQLHDQWVQHPYGPQSQRNHYDLEDHLEKSYARIRLVLSILQGQLEFWGNFLRYFSRGNGKKQEDSIGSVLCSCHLTGPKCHSNFGQGQCTGPKSMWSFTKARDLLCENLLAIS